MLCEFQACLLYIGSSRAARTMERPCLETHNQHGLECVHIVIFFGFLCKILFYAFSFNYLSVYLFCVCVCVSTGVFTYMLQHMSGEVNPWREVPSVLCGSWDLNLGQQVLGQVPLSTKPSY